jgi:hypothetical protein
MEPAEASRLRNYVQPRPDQPKVMAFARTEHHLVLAQFDRAGIAIFRYMADGQQPWGSRGDAGTHDRVMPICQVSQMDRLRGR